MTDSPVSDSPQRPVVLALWLALLGCNAGVQSPSAETCPAQLGTNLAALESITVIGEEVYWVDQTSTMFRVPRCGGTPQRATKPGVATLSNFAGGDNIVLESESTRTLFRPAASAEGVQLDDGPENRVLMTANETMLAWTTPNKPSLTPVFARTRRVGDIWRVAEAENINAIAMDDKDIYIATQESVGRTSLTAGPLTELVARPGGVSALALTDMHVLISYRTKGIRGGGTIAKLPKAGGLLLTLAAESHEIVASTVLDSHVYYVTRSEFGAGHVRRVGTQGGVIETLAETKNACSIAVDATAVYVGTCEAGRGSLNRIALH